jgi:hypothetical protein
MQWSQLKHRIEAGFAPALGGRVRVWTTVYRNLTEGDGRAWVTFDKEEIYSMEDFPGNTKMNARCELWNAEGYAAMETPATGSMLTCRDFVGSLHDFLRTDFATLLDSDDPILRGLALLDRRLGRRRFEKIDPAALTHPFVKKLHQLRAEAEGWKH